MPDMPEMIEVEVWVMVNSDGEYAVGPDRDEVVEAWTEGDEGFQCGLPQRLVQVKLRLPKPVPVVVTAELPAEPTDGVAVKVA